MIVCTIFIKKLKENRVLRLGKNKKLLVFTLIKCGIILLTPLLCTCLFTYDHHKKRKQFKYGQFSLICPSLNEDSTKITNANQITTNEKYSNLFDTSIEYY